MLPPSKAMRSASGLFGISFQTSPIPILFFMSLLILILLSLPPIFLSGNAMWPFEGFSQRVDGADVCVHENRVKHILSVSRTKHWEQHFPLKINNMNFKERLREHHRGIRPHPSKIRVGLGKAWFLQRCFPWSGNGFSSFYVPCPCVHSEKYKIFPVALVPSEFSFSAPVE